MASLYRVVSKDSSTSTAAPSFHSVATGSMGDRTVSAEPSAAAAAAAAATSVASQTLSSAAPALAAAHDDEEKSEKVSRSPSEAHKTLSSTATSKLNQISLQIEALDRKIASNRRQYTYYRDKVLELDVQNTANEVLQNILQECLNTSSTNQVAQIFKDKLNESKSRQQKQLEEVYGVQEKDARAHAIKTLNGKDKNQAINDLDQKFTRAEAQIQSHLKALSSDLKKEDEICRNDGKALDAKLRAASQMEGNLQTDFGSLNSEKESLQKERDTIIGPPAKDIWSACASGDIGFIQEAMKGKNQKQFFSAKNEMGQNPLHVATSSGQTKTVEFLLNQKADLEARDVEGNYSIHLAAKHNQSELIEVFATQAKDYVNKKGPMNRTALHVATFHGHFMASSTLIHLGADVNAQIEKTLVTPLHNAVYGHHWDVAKSLIQTYHLDLSKKDQLGKTALDEAYEQHQKLQQSPDGIPKSSPESDAVVQLLIKRKNNPPAQDVWAACKTNDLNYLRTAAAKAWSVSSFVNKKDTTDPNQPTFLIFACLFEHNSMIDFLLKNQADPKIADKQGWLPVHYAAKSSTIHGMKALSDAKADLNAQTPEGEAPLHIAIKNKKQEIVDYLINRRANVNIQTKTTGETPLHYAIMFGNEQALLAILGATGSQHVNLNIKDKFFCTPLFRAVTEGFLEGVENLICDPNCQKNYGEKDPNDIHLLVRIEPKKNQHKIRALLQISMGNAPIQANEEEKN